MSDPSLKTHYDLRYRQSNYFGQRRFLFASQVKSIIKYCGISKGATVLDVGCGQGLFSWLFAQQGLRVTALDFSHEAICAAQQRCKDGAVVFLECDVFEIPPERQFDAVFVRSFSLHNRDDFPDRPEVSQHLARFVKPGGVLIFVYNSRVSGGRSMIWRHHSVADVRRHFSWTGVRDVFVVNKLLMCVFGRLLLSKTGSALSTVVSRITGLGVDLVFVWRKPLSRGRGAVC